MRTKLIALLLASAGLAVTASACKKQESAETGQAAVSASGLDLAAMDKGVKPGDDFFAYANGNWVKSTQIPEDRSSIGGFYIADQQRERQTRELLDSILKSKPAAGRSSWSQWSRGIPPVRSSRRLEAAETGRALSRRSRGPQRSQRLIGCSS